MNYNQADQHQDAALPFTTLTNRLPFSGNQNVPELSMVTDALAHLEALRQHPVLLYMAQDQAPYLKLIEDDDVVIFYDALCSLGPLEHLDLVVNTVGGNVTTVRKLLHVLHKMVSHLTILIPYKACSAGTLLCLGAHDIVLTPIAELSPIDPQLQGMQGGNASQHSSEDVASFRTMARDWFGVNNENQDHALSLLRLFCEKIFPLSLTHFFRAEQLVRQVALEALQFQLPDASVDTHQHIIGQLLSGYADHLYPLNSTDLLHLGLHVTQPSPKEELALWSLWQRSRAYLDTSEGTPGGDNVDGLLLGAGFTAHHRAYVSPLLLGKQQEGEAVTTYFRMPRWERLESYA